MASEPASESAPPRVLIIGVDPRQYADRWDPTPILQAIERGDRRFSEYGISHLTALVPVDDEAERTIVDLLDSEPWACVVIGGGVRGGEGLLEYFELLVNRVRQHAPQAAIAFNSGPEDCADAARRWLPAT